jgi:hypothetical protein
MLPIGSDIEGHVHPFDLLDDLDEAEVFASDTRSLRRNSKAILKCMARLQSMQLGSCQAGSASLEVIMLVAVASMLVIGLLDHLGLLAIPLHVLGSGVTSHGATASAGLIAPRLGRGARAARHTRHGHHAVTAHIAHHGTAAHSPVAAHVPGMMANLHAFIALVAPQWHLIAIAGIFLGVVFCAPVFGHDRDRGVRHGLADVPIERDHFLMQLLVGGMVIFFVGLATGVIGPINGFGPGLLSHFVGSVTSTVSGAQGVV